MTEYFQQEGQLLGVTLDSVENSNELVLRTVESLQTRLYINSDSTLIGSVIIHTDQPILRLISTVHP